MLYDRSDVSGIDVNKTNASKNVVFCPNWYFFRNVVLISIICL